MTLKRKVQIGLAVLIVVFLSSMVMTLEIVDGQHKHLEAVGELNEKIDTIYIKLADNAKKMNLNIVQVQQYVQDLGATRGLLGAESIKEDNEKIQENAESFTKLAAESRALAEKADEKELVKLIDEAIAGFPGYLEQGRVMAKVYMAEGAEAGNKLMPKFDDASDKLQTPLGKILDRTAALYDEANKIGHDKIDEVKKSASHVIALTAAANAFVLLLLLAGAYTLFRGVIRPIISFSSCLDAIAKGDLSQEVVGVGRSDEIGEMAEAMQGLKADLGETFKLRQMLETMPYNVMFADPAQDFKITFCNKSSLDTLRGLEAHLPKKASQVIGENFDIFHKSPTHQRKMLADPKNLPHTAKFKLGPETLALTVSAIYDKSGNYMGPMATWEVITKQVELANMFERNVKSVVDAVSSTAQNVNGSARTLSGSAEQTSHQAVTGAAAAEQASANVQTVAAAAEELSASIGEITNQVNEASRIAQAAASEAQQTNANVSSLAEATQKIGDVVNLINQIAGQTNLLALNATIEAARAGEAGKGFAVVASEVKNLASQTSKATEDIARQIDHLQSVTQTAVGGITTITKTIERINQIQTSVTAAIGQQNAATREISQNVQEASQGTAQVSQTIAEVTRVSQETGAEAASLLSSASDLIAKSKTLSTEVDKFLQNIRS